MLRQARIRKFMSQADVTRECAERGIALDPGNLSKIERGLVKWPALRTLPILADILGLDVADLFEAEAA